MTQKAISLSTAAATLAVYLWSQLQPNAALFSIISANLAVNIGLVFLTALLVRLSFTNKFKTVLGYELAAGGAAAGLLVGLSGLFGAIFNYTFYNWFGPLDFLLLTQAGIFLAICALSYQHQPIKLKPVTLASLPKVHLPQISLQFPRLAIQSLRSLRFN